MHTILVVDDQPDTRHLLRAALSKQYTVIEAEDGASALRAMHHSRPSLVFLDVMMPGDLDGLQVLQQIKLNPQSRNTPVAILSARGQAADQDEARKCGADAYFVKPFSPLQVLSWAVGKLA